MNPRAHVQRALVALGPIASWLLLLGASRHWHDTRPLVAASLWGLLLLASFVSWGRIWTALLGYGGRGWGFEAAVGMASAIFVFGILAYARLVSTTLIVIGSAAGPLAMGLLRARGAAPAPMDVTRLPGRVLGWLRRPRPLAFGAAIAALYGAAALQYLHSVADVSFNTWDDEMAYRSFARQFLDTGTLYEPFSYRRIGAYGGQSLLHAMVLSLTDHDRLHLVDNGLCVLVMLGLVTGYRAVSRSAARPGILAAGCLAMFLPYSPHNTAAAISGVVFFLALFRLFDDPRFESARPGPSAVLVGLFVAAVCTLRQNYLSAAVLFVAAVYLGLVAYPGRARRRAEWFRQGLLAGGATIVFLAPWMALSFRAAHTALYPLMKGTVRPDFGVVGRVPWVEGLRWAVHNLFVFKPISTIALFFVAAVALPASRRSGALHAFALCNALSFAMMMYVFQNFDDADSIGRYYFAFSVAFCVAATLRCMADGSTPGTKGRSLVPAALTAAAVGLHFVDAKDTLEAQYSGHVAAVEAVVTQGQAAPTTDDALYQRIQASVPKGAAVLVILDHSYLLDGRRNPLFQYDHPGAMGPAPGPPCFKGPEAFAQYLRSVGVRYIAYQVGPSSQEYNPDTWRVRAAAVVPTTGRDHFFYKNQARFELDFFETSKALEATHRSLFHEGDIRVLDLESPAA